MKVCFNSLGAVIAILRFKLLFICKRSFLKLFSVDLSLLERSFLLIILSSALKFSSEKLLKANILSINLYSDSEYLLDRMTEPISTL